MKFHMSGVLFQTPDNRRWMFTGSPNVFGPDLASACQILPGEHLAVIVQGPARPPSFVGRQRGSYQLQWDAPIAPSLNDPTRPNSYQYVQYDRRCSRNSLSALGGLCKNKML